MALSDGSNMKINNVDRPVNLENDQGRGEQSETKTIHRQEAERPMCVHIE
jgi:hypothetical protein